MSHRFYEWTNTQKDLCPHIKLVHVQDVGEGCGEYTESMYLYCNKCNKEFEIKIEVN